MVCHSLLKTLAFPEVYLREMLVQNCLERISPRCGMETGNRQDFTGNGDMVYMKSVPQNPKNLVSKIKHSRPAG